VHYYFIRIRAVIRVINHIIDLNINDVQELQRVFIQPVDNIVGQVGDARIDQGIPVIEATKTGVITGATTRGDPWRGSLKVG
jgi:hypothetical protein